MAAESGKPKSVAALSPDPVSFKELETSRTGQETHNVADRWTDEHEALFQYLIEEFGGAPERDPDL